MIKHMCLKNPRAQISRMSVKVRKQFRNGPNELESSEQTGNSCLTHDRRSRTTPEFDFAFTYPAVYAFNPNA